MISGVNPDFMKSHPRNDVHSGSLPDWPQNPSVEQSSQSLFSLLLEIESQLRAEARRDSRLTAGKRNSTREEVPRQAVKFPSRYVE
jgi:hypothetical protein